jgi:hypothetical protein
VNRGCKRRGQRVLGLWRPNDKGEAGLVEWHIGARVGRRLGRAIFDISHNSHNLARRRGGAAERDRSANRILAWEIPPRRRFVDDHQRSDRRDLVCGEVATAQQPGLESVEVTRADAPDRVTFFHLLAVGTADDPEGGRRREPMAKWQEVGVSDGPDPGERGDPFRDATCQRAALLLIRPGRCICRGGPGGNRRHRHRGQLPCVEAGVHVEQPIEALAEQPRAHQKKHRDRELRHHEVRSEAPPRRSRRPTTAFPEPRGRFRGPYANGRRQREDHGCDRRDR